MDELFTERIRKLSRPLEVRGTGVGPELQSLKGVRAVLFAVYGTCFLGGSRETGDGGGDVEGVSAVDALSESLREQGVEVTLNFTAPAMARFEELMDQRRDQLRAAGRECPEVRILDIWEQWRREMGLEVDVPRLAVDVASRREPVWPMPGLIHTLEQLQARSVYLGLISNSQVYTPHLFPALTGHSLEAAGIPPSQCVWSWRLQEAKPSPRLFVRALEQLNDPTPEECLYVGSDMSNDILPAVKVGMRTALFAGDARSLRLRGLNLREEDLRPDLVITALSQLPNCLD